MTKLITYQYLRLESDISQNVEDKTLDNPIRRAMDMLSFVLGRTFYDELVSQFPDSFTSDNGSLFDPYIKKFLAWQSYEFYLIKANVYESRTGIRQFSDENSTVADETIMGNLIKDAKQWTQFYKGEMINFIKRQQKLDNSKYPLYRECGDRVGNGFHITSITARKINDKTYYNE